MVPEGHPSQPRNRATHRTNNHGRRRRRRRHFRVASPHRRLYPPRVGQDTPPRYSPPLSRHGRQRRLRRRGGRRRNRFRVRRQLLRVMINTLLRSTGDTRRPHSRRGGHQGPPSIVHRRRVTRLHHAYNRATRHKTPGRSTPRPRNGHRRVSHHGGPIERRESLLAKG